MIIFKGSERFAYRDPACFRYKGVYHLFFTVSEKENGYMYNRLALSRSADLKNWSEPCMLTPRELNLNYCSPGNIVEHEGQFVLCFTSYPMPFPYEQQDCADETARLFIMKTNDFEHFTQPEMLLPKDDIPAEELGRMIDPFLLPADGGYYLFFKQNGVSRSFSNDLKKWRFLGRAEGGENACVIPYQDGYLLVHSPKNGIAFSFSHDLKNWNEYGMTTLGQNGWPWAEDRVTAGFVMEAPAECAHRYLLFFHGSRKVYPETHGNASLALAFTNDFREFAYEISWIE